MIGFKCWNCKAEFIPLENHYPCGPCPDKWKCKNCGEKLSPCCGAKIIIAKCFGECEVCDYCGSETCSNCNEHCHCGGCI